MKKTVRKTKIKDLIHFLDETSRWVEYIKKGFFFVILSLLSINIFGCASARIDLAEKSKTAHNLVIRDILSAGLDDSFRESLYYEPPEKTGVDFSVMKAVYHIPPYIEFNNIVEKLGDTLPENFYVETYQPKQAPPMNESRITVKKYDAVIAEIIILQHFNAVMAIVIDDVGNNSKAIETSLMIKRPITYAVLPKLQLTKKLAKILYDHGHVVILHQPMAAVNDIYPGPGYIEKDMDEAQIIDLLNENFAEIPWAAGMNNHMGSAVTADERIMEIILNYLKINNLFFLDSVTGETVCAGVAEKIGYPIYTRDVFIDNKNDKIYINKQIDQLVKIALKYGQAIGIGHFKPLTMQCVYERLEDFDSKGIRLVYLNELPR